MAYRLTTGCLDQAQWDSAVGSFPCASIYQSWWYGHVHGKGSLRSVSTAVLLDGDSPVVMALFQIKRVPIGAIGVAEAVWGPLWNHEQNAAAREQLAAFLEQVREEYGAKRRLEVRFVPCSTASADVDEQVDEIFMAKGFCRNRACRPYRTFILDLRKSLVELRRALHQKWRNQLSVAEKANMIVEYGNSAQMFDRFVKIYDQMWQRKRFATGVRISHIRETIERSRGQQFLIAIASIGGNDVGATVCTMAGQTVLYFLGATSVNLRQDSRPGYLLQWRNIEEAKRRGYTFYDTGGVPDDLDGGVYRFKERMGGSLLTFPGRYDYASNQKAARIFALAERGYRRLRTVLTGK